MMNLDWLVGLVCEAFDVTPKQFRSPRGPQKVTDARRAFIWIALHFMKASNKDLRKYIRLTWGAIAFLRDTAAGFIEHDKVYRSRVFEIARKVSPDFKNL